MNLLMELLKEYQRLLDLRQEYEEWKMEFPEPKDWDYPGIIMPKERIKRTGLLIRQTMVDFEKEMEKSPWE